MSITLNSDGMKRKLHNLRNLNTFFRDFPQHSALFAKEQISAWELNFNPVNVVSGILMGSPTVDFKPYSATMTVNGNHQAPYANWVRKLYIRKGKGDYMQLFRDRVRPIIAKEFKEESHRAAEVIERGGNYTYKNPYYV
jgi:hypothetical protein